MSSLPPDQGFNSPGDMGASQEPFNWSGDQQPIPAGPRGRRMSTSRIVLGSVWGVITLLLVVGGVLEITSGNGGGAVVTLLVAALAGWFDWRAWGLHIRRARSTPKAP
jgi:hypothetical protein